MTLKNQLRVECLCIIGLPLLIMFVGMYFVSAQVMKDQAESFKAWSKQTGNPKRLSLEEYKAYIRNHKR